MISKSFRTNLLVIISMFLLSPPALSGDSKKISYKKDTVKRALAANKKKRKSAEEVDVESIKKKYWAGGDESQMGVVQNRKFAKAKRFQFGIMGGKLSNDPFLTTKVYGLNVGYHFSERLGLLVHYWKTDVNNSDALNTFQSENGGNTNTNETKNYIGAEVNWSILYGKLSLLGAKIIYYDLHMILGAGSFKTENGSYLTPSVGIGQRYFLSKSFSLRLDYRALFYREEIKEEVITNSLGNVVAERDSWSHVITLGFDFFFGGTGQ